jgi:hypothetical protein
MNHRRIIISLVCGILIIICILQALSNDAINIHPFIQSKDYCVKCHAKDKKNLISDPAIACAPLCLSCHKDIKNHHSVNVKIVEKLPEEFNLTKKNRLTCITCHNVKIMRFDNSSWKSESLYEKVFKGTTKHKTYFLVIKNNEGQLCKKCH